MFEQHPVFKAPDDANIQIWRYMDLPKYISILDQSAVYFCRSDRLGDEFVEDMGVRPTQLTENSKNRLAKLFRILTCQMCRPDTHALEFLKVMKMTDIQKYREVEMTATAKSSKAFKLWAIGSFFLLALAVIVSLFLIITSRGHGFFMTLAIFVAVEIVFLLLGALTLRTTGDLSEKGFLDLVKYALREQLSSFKFISRAKVSKNESAQP